MCRYDFLLKIFILYFVILFLIRTFVCFAFFVNIYVFLCFLLRPFIICHIFFYGELICFAILFFIEILYVVLCFSLLRKFTFCYAFLLRTFVLCFAFITFPRYLDFCIFFIWTSPIRSSPLGPFPLLTTIHSVFYNWCLVLSSRFPLMLCLGVHTVFSLCPPSTQFHLYILCPPMINPCSIKDRLAV